MTLSGLKLPKPTHTRVILENVIYVKLAIMKADPESLLNTRDEFVFKCRHMSKFRLRFFKKK